MRLAPVSIVSSGAVRGIDLQAIGAADR